MDNIEYRAVIKFFVKVGLTLNEIHSKFIKVYGDSSPSFSTIKKWAAEFKRGRTSLEDDAREGRPKSATTPEIIEQVHDMVLDNRRMKVPEIAETIGISKERTRVHLTFLPFMLRYVVAFRLFFNVRISFCCVQVEEKLSFF